LINNILTGVMLSKTFAKS